MICAQSPRLPPQHCINLAHICNLRAQGVEAGGSEVQLLIKFKVSLGYKRSCLTSASPTSLNISISTSRSWSYKNLLRSKVVKHVWEARIWFCKSKIFIGIYMLFHRILLEKREYYAALKMNEAVWFIVEWKGLPHTWHDAESKCDILFIVWYFQGKEYMNTPTYTHISLYIHTYTYT